MRVAVAGIHIECATSNPCRTGLADFEASRGARMASRYPFRDREPFAEWDWQDLVHFRALPGGPVGAAAYAAMKAEIAERLLACLAVGPLDGFLLDIHGAMVVEGLEDAEAELIESIRAHLGPELPIAVAQDLHGNLSDRFVAQADVITCYRTAPHLDVIETRERACRLLARCFEEGLPWRAWTPIPVLLSGEYTSTLVEPAESIYEEVEQGGFLGVWDWSLWAGYPWADEARAQASAFACGSEVDTTSRAVAHLGRRWWQAREQFELLSPAGPARERIEAAWGQSRKPVFLSDSGDNPTAGGAGDLVGTLAELLAFAPLQEIQAVEEPPRAIFASIPAPAAAALAHAAGVNAEVEVRLGGELDPAYPALTLRGRVRSLARSVTGGLEVAIHSGGVAVIVTERRHPFHRRADFVALGLEPEQSQIVVVKIGYLEPELAAMAASHAMILSPGAVDQDWRRMSHRRLARPMFPYDRDFDWSPRPRVWAPGER